MADENMNTIHITEKQKVQEITDKLEEGLKELFESEKYKTSRAFVEERVWISRISLSRGGIWQ